MSKDQNKIILKVMTKYKTSMEKSNLCDYSDAYVLVNETAPLAKTGTAATSNNVEKEGLKNCAPFFLQVN